MTRFILLSIFIHGLAAGLSLYYFSQQAEVPRPGSALLLSLQTFSEPARSRQPAPSPASEPAPQQQATAHGIKNALPVIEQAADAAIEVEPQQNAATKTPVSADNPDTLNSLRAAVYSALRASFTYPRRARQRGWEGTVVISLRILPDGNLTNIQVANSSGISVLDRAAMHSIQQITVPQAIAWMQGKELDMMIPVEYRLLDT